MNEIVETSLVEIQPHQVLPESPENTRDKAIHVANILTEIIEKQKLYVSIQGKKYVKVDAWIGLGNLMGLFPREVYVKELEDGGYESCVELVQANTGMVLGRASAICGMDEKRWGSAEKFARRSMSTTRATGKAFRLAYSWVMCLAGFEATPSEEMPTDAVVKKAEAVPFDPLEKETYKGTEVQKRVLRKIFQDKNVIDEKLKREISQACLNYPVDGLVERVTQYLQVPI